MKKLFLIKILLLSTFILSAQDCKINNIKPFKVGIDTYSIVQDKLSEYRIYTYSETMEGNDVLTDIYVENFIYHELIGELELFIGNDKLYYIRFTSYSIDFSISAISNKLFDYFKIYWNE